MEEIVQQIENFGNIFLYIPDTLIAGNGNVQKPCLNGCQEIILQVAEAESNDAK